MLPSLQTEVEPIVNQFGTIGCVAGGRSGATDNEGIPCNGRESEVVPLEFLLKEKTVTMNANFIAEARDIVRRNILAVEKDFDR